MELRYFSGKYDTVKQKSTFLDLIKGVPTTKGKRVALTEEEAWENLYLYYSATLRMEMFFTEKVILTDALWYDGAYFSSMVEKTDEFRGFSKFLSTNPLIEVRRRDDYVARMFGKGFEFSSLIQDISVEGSFSKLVYEFGIEKGLVIKKDIHTMQAYIALLKQYINDKQSYGFLTDADRFEERMMRLDMAKGVAFQPWENGDSLPRVFDSDINSAAGRSKGEIITNRKALSNLYCQYAQDYPSLRLEPQNFDLHLGQTGMFPNRTEIVRLLKRQGQMDTRAMEIYTKFNALYSKGLSIQHNCTLYDGMENNAAVVKAKTRGSFLESVLELPKQIAENVGACPWEEFSDIFSRSELQKARNGWIATYKQSHATPNAQITNRAIGELNELVKVILYSFDKIKNSVFNNSVFYDTQNGNTYVGSASNEFNTLGDDICFFFPNPNKKARIIRMFSMVEGKEADKCLDTIIAFPAQFDSMLQM